MIDFHMREFYESAYDQVENKWNGDFESHLLVPLVVEVVKRENKREDRVVDCVHPHFKEF